MQDIKSKLKNNWLKAAIGIFAVLLISFAVYTHIHNKDTKEVPVITTVTGTAPAEIKETIPDISDGDAKDISRRIEYVKENTAPTYHYVTYTQAAADEKAQEYASKEKADKVIKTTTETTPTEQDTVDSGGKLPSVYENNYYAINMERKHRISVGVMAIDNKAYGAVSYNNRDVTATVYSKDFKGIDGASVMYTVAKW